MEVSAQSGSGIRWSVWLDSLFWQMSGYILNNIPQRTHLLRFCIWDNDSELSLNIGNKLHRGHGIQRIHTNVFYKFVVRVQSR